MTVTLILNEEDADNLFQLFEALTDPEKDYKQIARNINDAMAAMEHILEVLETEMPIEVYLDEFDDDEIDDHYETDDFETDPSTLH